MHVSAHKVSKLTRDKVELQLQIATMRLLADEQTSMLRAEREQHLAAVDELGKCRRARVPYRTCRKFVHTSGPHISAHVLALQAAP